MHLYIDGLSSDAVQINTRVAGQHAIDCVATDQAHLTATSTRTVIVAALVNDNDVEGETEPAANDYEIETVDHAPLPATGTE